MGPVEFAMRRALGLEFWNALVPGSEFVDLHVRSALDDAGIDEGLTFPANNGRRD